MKQDMTVIDFFNILKKHIVLIAGVAILGMALSGIKTHFFMKPTYTSVSQVEIIDKRENAKIDKDLKRVVTYKEFLRSDKVIKLAKSNLKNDYSIKMNKKKLRNSVSMGNTQGSLILYISTSYTGNNRKQVTKINKSVNKAYVKKANGLFKDNEIKRITKSTVPAGPAGPNLQRNMMMGLLSGLVLGLIAAFLLGSKKVFKIL